MTTTPGPLADSRSAIAGMQVDNHNPRFDLSFWSADGGAAPATMRETWLRPNVRVLSAALIPAVLAFLAGGAVVVLTVGGEQRWGTLGGGLLMAFALAGVAFVVQMLRTPRMAYEEEHLLFFLGPAAPFRVPVEDVECFFLGQAPTHLAVADQSGAETRTVVVRLREAAETWKQRDVKSSLGHWCDGYVTIRGTWCEPITPDLVKGLNHRLVELHRQRRASRTGRAGGSPSSAESRTAKPKDAGAPAGETRSADARTAEMRTFGTRSGQQETP